MLNERRQRALHMLLTAEHPLPAAEIGRWLGCPARAVRYDLEAISEWVSRHGGRLVGVAGIGYHLEGDLHRVREALESLPLWEGPPMDYILSPRERVRRLLLHLLGAGAPLSLQVLADRLGVSKSTVHNDLTAVEDWCWVRGLMLERTSAGALVAGREPLLRKAMADLIMELADEGQLALLLEGHPDVEPLQLLLRPMLPRIDWLALGRAVREVPSPEVTVHLIVMVSRLLDGCTLTYQPNLLERVTGHGAWHRARRLAAAVTRECRITLPTTEQAMLALLFETARAPVDDAASPSEEDLATARSLAGLLQAHLGVSLVEDQEFVVGLALHLRPIRLRVLRQLTIENPLLNEVRTTYPAAYRAAQELGRVLGSMWRLTLPEAEVGYLAIHVAAALERARLRHRTPARALLVCGAGVGTAQLLALRLRSNLPELAVGPVVSAFQVKEALEAQPFDLIIATCHVPETAVPVVRVSPLVTDQELARIRSALQSANILPQRGRQPVLADLVTPSTILLDVPVKDWEEAVRTAGNLLVRVGAAEERYVDAMVDTCKKLGPYIVLGPGFALPHARPEEGVLRVSMALVRLKHPVAFGHPDNDPVDLVIALGAIDHESHLKALMELSDLLGDAESVAALRAAPDIQSVLQLVARASNPAAGAQPGGV
ncbi:MAG: BglG family transcription antiterminator [Bacillota bacterium]